MRKKRKLCPKYAATKDIKESLQQNGKCFIAFRVELDPAMKQLVIEYINAQSEKGGCHGKSENQDQAGTYKSHHQACL